MNFMKDLLKDAVARTKIGKQVQAALVVEETDKILTGFLLERHQDAKTVSYKNQRLLVACKNGACAQFINEREPAIIQALKLPFPGVIVEKIITRVVARFPSSEV